MQSQGDTKNVPSDLTMSIISGSSQIENEYLQDIYSKNELSQRKDLKTNSEYKSSLTFGCVKNFRKHSENGLFD